VSELTVREGRWGFWYCQTQKTWTPMHGPCVSGAWRSYPHLGHRSASVHYPISHWRGTLCKTSSRPQLL